MVGSGNRRAGGVRRSQPCRPVLLALRMEEGGIAQGMGVSSPTGKGKEPDCPAGIRALPCQHLLLAQIDGVRHK